LGSYRWNARNALDQLINRVIGVCESSMFGSTKVIRDWRLLSPEENILFRVYVHGKIQYMCVFRLDGQRRYPRILLAVA